MSGSAPLTSATSSLVYGTSTQNTSSASSSSSSSAPSSSSSSAPSTSSYSVPSTSTATSSPSTSSAPSSSSSSSVASFFVEFEHIEGHKEYIQKLINAKAMADMEQTTISVNWHGYCTHVEPNGMPFTKDYLRGKLRNIQSYLESKSILDKYPGAGYQCNFYSPLIL